MVRRNHDREVLCHLVFFAAAIVWLELVYRVFYVKGFLGRGLLYILLFSLGTCAACTLVTAFFERKKNYIATLTLTSLITLWYMVQAVYHTIFGTVLVTKSFNMMGQALGSYWRETLEGIWRSFPVLLLMALPVVYLVVRKKIALSVRVDGRIMLGLLGGIVGLHLMSVLALSIPTGGVMTMREIYRESFIPDLTTENFGVLTTLRLDLTQSVFGLEQSSADPVPVLPAMPPAAAQSDAEQETTGKPPLYKANVMDIDFEALIAQETDSTLKGMHQYFKDREPTLQNEYTGMFAGKNLILITAEAFWVGAVDEKYTPTLWKLANTGFVFENFYNPLWYYSTVDGEYAAVTGLIPSNQVNASQRYAGKNGNSMYFTMGRQLGALGYPTLAYHNNTAEYYDRNHSHPNMGYDFYAADTGLDVAMTWPQSDLEMMELTLPQALAGAKPFHNYYMTVSGHMNYNFLGNKMAAKHKNEVEDLDMSDPAKAYLACNMELDRALEYTLRQLEAAGELENTVICLSSDHYPYGLDGTGAIDEFAGAGTEADPWEKHRSVLILWSGDMAEPIVVEKPCSSIDVIPTLSNLFGLEYDSRLLAGQDILSNAPGLVIFNNRSFITEAGRYNAKDDAFYPNAGLELSEDYASGIYRQVRNIMNHSGNILFQDYYRKIGLVH